MNNTIKNLVNVLSAVVGVMLLSGIFGWEVGEGFTTFAGLVIIVCTIWLLVLVHKKQ